MQNIFEHPTHVESFIEIGAYHVWSYYKYNLILITATRDTNNANWLNFPANRIPWCTLYHILKHEGSRQKYQNGLKCHVLIIYLKSRKMPRIAIKDYGGALRRWKTIRDTEKNTDFEWRSSNLLQVLWKTGYSMPRKTGLPRNSGPDS